MYHGRRADDDAYDEASGDMRQILSDRKEKWMRIGAVFSQADSGTDPDAIRQWAIDAEAAGFEHLMAYDHVLGASPARLGPGPFGSFPSAPYTAEHTWCCSAISPP